MLRWQNIRRLRTGLQHLPPLAPRDLVRSLLSDGPVTVYTSSHNSVYYPDDFFSRVHNADFHVPFRRDNASLPPSSLVLIGPSHVERRYPQRTPVADRSSPARSDVAARARSSRRRQCHSAVRRHLTARAARRTIILRWGLRVPAGMFVLAVYFGALYSAFQSNAGILYAEIIPPGEEARWYHLFSITDEVKFVQFRRARTGSRLIWGWEATVLVFHMSLVVGLVTDLTGNIRYAFHLVSIL